MDGSAWARRGAVWALVTAWALGGVAGAVAEQWYPSRWGPNDEIGAANFLTPAKVLEAAKLIKTGKVYALGIVVDRDTPAFPPRSLSVTVLQPNQAKGASFGENKMTYNDDIFTGWLGIGTQLDGLGHLGIDGVYYNGNRAEDFAKVTGLTKLGIEKVPPIVTRGVLLDIAGYKGVDMMKEGEVITVADIEGAAKKQGVSIRKGDVVILHTGWLSLLGKDNARYAAGEPGIGVPAAEYLAKKEVVAVGADTWGVEVVPFEKKERVWEAHQVLLAKNGIYILETLNTAPLVKDRAWEFLFVLGHPLYRGAVQAIINPVAIR